MSLDKKLPVFRDPPPANETLEAFAARKVREQELDPAEWMEVNGPNGPEHRRFFYDMTHMRKEPEYDSETERVLWAIGNAAPTIVRIK